MAIPFEEAEQMLIQAGFKFMYEDPATPAIGTIRTERSGSYRYVIYIEYNDGTYSPPLETEAGRYNGPLADEPIANYVFSNENLYRWVEENKIRVDSEFEEQHKRPWLRGERKTDAELAAERERARERQRETERQLERERERQRQQERDRERERREHGKK
ncbi:MULTISPECIES: hypothetical protein [Alteromonadaceae]|uniref:hypothetical protein n=1 Tax=Alteromonadaceae TaxID=72275 RepID=UPI001C098D7C|nr:MULTISPECIES: hypothetical protein [Aliiglaciecola]MBU2876887.1 hypothetical protein [Aliiglaciecola lipolytica]MDO6713199.1 hypothetical protein [Aliiglaciecola sp. 2_MG-2023]MDO6754315.1 hypothetical protein [Aliiglaciecola sp. 1_MG-2023]